MGSYVEEGKSDMYRSLFEDKIKDAINSKEEEEDDIFTDTNKEEIDELAELFEENQSLKNDSWRRKFTAALTVMAVAMGKINISMVIPIFPMLALPKGIGPGQQSFVLIVPDMVGTVAMLFWGKVMPKLGLKFTLVMGVVSMGVIGCLFGMLEFLPAGNVFYVSALAIRIFEGNILFLQLSLKWQSLSLDYQC